MPWIKLDDGFAINPKITRISMEAECLYVAVLAEVGRQLTDGHVHPSMIHIAVAGRHQNPMDLVDELVNGNLWVANADGWTIPDYLDDNPPAEQVKEKRRKDKERKRAQRLGSVHEPVRTDVHRDSHTDGETSRTRTRVSTDVDTHVVRTPDQPSTVEPIDTELSEHLRDRIQGHTGNRLKIGKAWPTDMSRLRRLGPTELEGDNPKTPNEIRSAIDFVFDHLTTPNAGGFCWANNIHSPSKLREKWLKLETAYQEHQTPRTGQRPATKQPADMAGVDLAFALKEQDPAA